MRRMRPDQPWGDVVRVLNHGQQASPAKPEVCAWTVERLRRTVQRLAHEGIVEAGLLGRARRQGGDDRLVAGIKAAASGRTLQQIATQLEAMRVSPRGGTRCHPSSVKHLLGQAEQLWLAGSAASKVAPDVWRWPCSRPDQQIDRFQACRRWLWWPGRERHDAKRAGPHLESYGSGAVRRPDW